MKTARSIFPLVPALALSATPTTKFCLNSAAFLVFVLFIHGHTLELGFPWIDSPTILMQGILYSPLKYFWDPYSYSLVTPGNLTPTLTLSWYLDYLLFGLNPSGFRWHHFIAFVAMMLAIHYLSWRFCQSAFAALVFTAALAVTPAAHELAAFLVDRHYVEGMLFSALSVVCVLRYDENRHWPWLAASVALYAVAITAKEIYVPLPLILFFLFSGDLRQRLVMMAPYAFIIGVYVPWRLYMLKGMGGYGNLSTLIRLPNLGDTDASGVVLGTDRLVPVLRALGWSLLGSPWRTGIALALFLTVFAVAWRKLPAMARFGVFCGFIAVVAPLASLLPTMEAGIICERWFWVPLTAAALLLAHYSRMVPRLLRYVVVASAGLLALGGGLDKTYLQRYRSIFNDTLVQRILSADSTAYILQLNSIDPLLILPNQTPQWVTLHKLHSGNWGTLVLSWPAQLLYHDISRRQAVDTANRPLPDAQNALLGAKQELEMIESVDFDANAHMLTFSFTPMATEAERFVYLYGPDNGLPLGLPRIDNGGTWSISIVELDRQLRRLGYTVNEANVAVWRSNGSEIEASKPYALKPLLESAGIAIEKYFPGP